MYLCLFLFCMCHTNHTLLLPITITIPSLASLLAFMGVNVAELSSETAQRASILKKVHAHLNIPRTDFIVYVWGDSSACVLRPAVAWVGCGRR